MTRTTVLAPAIAFVLVFVACNGILGIPEVERLPAEAGAGPGPGTSSSGGCAENQKSCGGRCVDVESAVTGCGAVSCEPCKEIANGVPGCFDGACAVGSCSPGWGDCNRRAEDGCEHRVNEPKNCGACGFACQPGFTCEGEECACGDATACRHGGSCTAGRCVCAGETCFPGWLCAEDGGCSPL